MEMKTYFVNLVIPSMSGNAKFDFAFEKEDEKINE